MEKKYTFSRMKREEYMKRNGFEKTDYYKIVEFSIMLYRQAVEYGKDIAGNTLSGEQVQMSAMLVERMTRELAQAKVDYEENSNESESE